MKKIIMKLSRPMVVALLLTFIVSCSNDNNNYPPFTPTVVVTFTQDPNNGLIFQFNTGYITNTESMMWDFGDGGTSTDANPAYTYTVGGAYTVTLTLKGTEGADLVKEIPVEAFTYESITVVNGDFELPVTTNQIRSWADPSIPGWTSDDPRIDDQDSGVQNGNGGRTGYLKSSSPYNPYQTTDFTIATAGTTFRLRCVFGDAWNCKNAKMILYYLEDDGVTRTPLGSKTYPQDNYATVRELQVESTPESVGKYIGIEFDNTDDVDYPDGGDSWLGIDNVELAYRKI